MRSIPPFSQVARVTQAAVLGVAVILAYTQWSFLGLLLAAGFAVQVATLWRRVTPKVTPLDFAVVLLLAYEVPSVATSIYPPNGWPFLDNIISAVLVYFYIRVLAPSSREVAMIAGIVTSLGAVLAINGLRRFASGVKLREAVGLFGITPFREKLNPGPPAYIAGEWYTVLLLIVPFALILICYLIRNRQQFAGVLAVGALLTISAELMATCSRAVVWASAAGLLICCTLAVVYRIASLKAGLKYLAGGAAAILLVAIAVEASFPGLTACYTAWDTSQVRSVRGRLGAWRNSLAGASDRLLWGIGSGNAVMAAAATSPVDLDGAFAVQVFSLPVQMVVEKGVAGAMCYAFFLFSAGLAAHRRLRGSGDPLGKMIYLTAISGVVMGCMRDIVYCSLFSHKVTVTLLFVLIGIATSPEPA